MKKTMRRGLSIRAEVIRNLDLQAVHGGQANSNQHSACPNSCVLACAPDTDYTCCSGCGVPFTGECPFSNACGGGA